MMSGKNVLRLFSLLAIVAGIFGCDMSENDSLLNPPLPDSVQVRVVNLTEGNIDLSINDREAVQDLLPRTSSSFSPFFNRDIFPITISGSGIIDTIQDGRFPSSASILYHYTYFVAGTNDTRRLITLSTSTTERQDLEEQKIGRLYFINSIPERSFLIRTGCRSGAQIFPTVVGPGFGTSQDFSEGDHSLYVFESDTAVEATTARITVARGDVIALVLAEENGVVKLYSIPLFLPTSSGGPLQQTIPETRNNASVRILNGLHESISSAEVLGQTTLIGQNISPLALSQPTTVDICTDAGGDTLVVITQSGDTSRTPLQVSVGGEVTAIIFEDVNGGVRLTTLNRPTGSTDAGTFLVRGVNLTTITAVAASAGAGSPSGVTAGFRLFSSPDVGSVTPFRELPTGLYPLTLEQTSSGQFYSGGLYRFDDGFYTLIAIEDNGQQTLYVLNESSGSTTLEPLQADGRSLKFFSMVPNELITFEGSTSLGTIRIEGVAYSYVYPGILPSEQVSISASGVTPITLDLSTSGYTVGVTGESNRELVAFTLPSEVIPSGKAGIRFLNAVPGEGELEIHSESAAGQSIGSSSFGTPSATVLRDARRQTFSVTVAGTNQEVAKITGVELSSERHYLLIVGPKGATSSSLYKYGTLWMQE